MRHFFVEQSELDGPVPALRGADARHIINVLRLKPKDSIGLFDGTGKYYEARIVAIYSGKVEVSIIGCCCPAVESDLELVVAQSFLKESKMDDLVRQLTELGITKWIPFISERSIPRPGDKRLYTREKRWNDIAKEAVKQCRRVKITEIGRAVSFSEMLTIENNCDIKMAFWENEKNLLDIKHLAARHENIKKILVMLGPEGGFTVQEIERARDSGFMTVSLGPRILRAETAAVSACTLIQFLFGDMGLK